MAATDSYRNEYEFEASITHSPHGWWSLVIMKSGDIVFDYNGSFDECLDWLDRMSGPDGKEPHA